MRKAVRMSFDVVVQIISVVVIPLIAFLYKESSSTKKELAEYKKEVAEKYAPREEMIRIEDKIDNLSQLIMDRLPKRAK